MKRSIRNKCIAVGNSVLLLVQSLFSPWVGILLAATPSVPVANISYTKESNEIHLSVSTKNTLQYLLSYRIASGKIDGVKGQDKQNPEFTKSIFIGTCTTETCVNQRPEKGIAKYASAQDSWIYRQFFIIENGTLQVISEGPTDAVTLSDDEMKWLESPDKSPPTTPTPTATPTSAPSGIENKVFISGYSPVSSVVTIDDKCMGDLYGSSLNCTANDVSIASVSAVSILDDGCASPSDSVTFKAVWDVQSTANQRYNVGLYFASGGQTSAVNGSCSISTLPYAPVPPWFDFDNNVCGDIEKTTVHPEITMTVKCADPDGNNILNVPYCTSWQQNSGTCTGPLDTVPGAPSKCNCNNGFQVPITVPFAAKIEVKKALVPINDAGLFSLHIDGVEKATGIGNGGTTGIVIVGAGTSVQPGASHTVSESAYGATVSSDYISAISCVDRGLQTFNGQAPLTISGMGPLTIPVDKNDDILCTATNTRKAGSIEVKKDVVPDNASTHWNMTVTGPATNTNELIGDATTGNLYAPLGTYTISESAGTGTQASDYVSTWNCTKNGQEYQSGTGVSITGITITKPADTADSVVCTFTNTRKQSTLKVIKHVINDDGGTKVAGDFSVSVSATNPNPSTFTGLESPGQTVTIDPGEYSVTENEHTGYKATYSSGCLGTLLPGESATCTITNDDIAPTLTLVKSVTNDNGGTATPDQFTLSAVADNQAYPYVKGYGPTVSGPIRANTVYYLAESGVSGYTAGSWICSTTGAGPVTSITAQPGQQVTCAITNDDQTGTLIVKKIVKNDNGGTLTADDFTFSVNGAAAIPFEADGQNDLTVNAGTYSITEPSVTGYATTYDNCTRVSVSNGSSATCTITNDDIAPILHLRKSVVNDNGGLSGATDWLLSATGSSQIVSYLYGPSPVDSTINFLADTYTLSESAGSGGYTPSQWSCVLNGAPPVLSSTVTLAIGEEATCTITNDDKQGTIHLYKDVVAPDGKTDVSDTHTFTVTIDGVSYDISESSPKDISLDSGLHTLTELPDAAYVYAGIWGVTDSDLLTEGIQFTTLPGQIITITVINKQTLGSISGQKYEDINGNGVQDVTEKGLSGWTITLDKNSDGTVDQSTVTDADGNYSFTGLDLATYKVREVAQSGYSQTSDDPSDITLTSGQNEQNVDFGNMPLGSITVTKVDSQNSGTDFPFTFQKMGAQSSSFVLDDDNDQDATYDDSIVFSDLTPTFYDIAEKAVDDWSVGIVECTSNINTLNPQNNFWYGTMSVALRPGEHLSCVFTNTRDTGTITLNKIWTGPGKQVTLAIGTSASGGQIASVQTGENGTDPLSTGAQTVNTGTYYVSEAGDLTDYTSSLECSDNQTPVTPGANNSIQVAKDHAVVCTFTNTRKSLPLYVTKYEDGNADGIRGDGELALDGWTMELFENASCSGEPVQSATTSSDILPGTVRFNDLYQGVSYWIKEVEQTPDWVLTTPNCQGYTIHDDLHSNNQMEFGNFHYAQVTGNKFEDVNNNGAYDDAEPYLNDWTIRLYKKALAADEWNFVDDVLTGSTGATGVYGFSGLSLGDYKVCEVKQDGWNQTYPAGTSGGSDLEAPNCNFFTVTGSGQTFIGNFGNVHFGTIIVSKYNDLDGDGKRDDNEPLLDDWEINLEGQPSQLTGSGDNETGKVRFSKLIPDTYSLSETMQSGWEQTGISCKSSIGVKITAQGEAYGHHGNCSGWNSCGNAETCAQWACEVKGYSTLVSYGDSRPCTQFNNCNLFYSRGSVQMNWGNWCNVMGVTDIVCSNGTSPTPTPTPTESPLTSLEKVFTVEKVSAQEGPSGYPVTLSAGDTMVCEIGNQYVPPELMIEKYNNRWPNAIGTGSDVSYTIVITAKNNKVYNVKVKDLLPKGFVYQKGSWSAVSSVHGALSLPEPTYASPGTWTVTSDSGSNIYPYMQSGEVITLRFKANTDASLDPGVYKDIAWAAGTAKTSTDSDMVLASSQATDKNVDPGVVTDTFVGTKVQLDTSRHNSVSLNVIHEETREGEVLGASTELPATGARSIWLMIAAMSILSGIGCLYVDKRNRRLHA